METKDALIQTGIKLIAEHGFAGVSVRDVTNAAGVSSGLLRHYFGSKEDFFDAIEAQLLEKAAARAREIEEVATTSPEKLWEASVHTRQQLNARERDYFKRLILERPGRAKAYLQSNWDGLGMVVDKMIEGGRVRSDVDLLWFRLMLLFLAYGPIYLSDFIKEVTGKHPYEDSCFEARTAAFADILENGFLPKNP